MLITLITYTLYALTFITPLIFTTWNYELFEFPKFILLLSGTLILVLSMVGEHILSRRRSPLNLWHTSTKASRLIHLAVISILLTQLLATIFSIVPTTSLWGYYGRFHQGLITTICYTIIYFAATIYLHKNSTQNLIKISISSSVMVSLYAIAQHFGVDKDLWVQDVQNRVFSTLGQPNWLASYLLPNLFLLLHLDYIKTRHRSNASYLTYALFTLLFAALLYTKSRSGTIAFGVGFAVYWLAMTHNFGFAKLKYRIITTTALVAATLLLIGTPFTSSITKTPSTLTPTVTPQGGSLESGGTESGVIRQIVWAGAVELVRRYPLLGTGPETFAYTYYQVRPVAHNLVSEWDFLYNKAHNEYLNIAATTGLIGLAGYLFFHFAMLYWGLTKDKHKDITTTSYKAVVLAAIVTFTITNFFGFSVIPVYLITVILAALATTTEQQVTPTTHTGSELLFVTLAIISLLLPLRLYLADYNYASGKKLAASGQMGQALPLLEAAHKSFPSFDLYQTTLAESYATIASDLSTQEDQAGAGTAYLTKALTTSKQLLVVNSYHQNNLKSVTKTYLTLAAIDPSYYTQAMYVMQTAARLAPTDSKIAYNLALISTRVGDDKQAISELQRSISLRPIYQDPYYALTLLYEETNQTELIPDLLQQAKQYLATYSAELRAKIEKY